MSQKTSAAKSAQQSEVRHHQLGQEVFKPILPDDIDWKPSPAFPPHKHPEDRVYTVISGVFYIGLGDEFDASNVSAKDDPRNTNS